MNRDFNNLSHGPFDLLVIGGGIYGAWTAYDAAGRGLKVALVEQNDWGSGTSQSSSKLIHGGLRYLEQFRLGLVKSALREREFLLRAAPHRVAPLRFVIPLYPGAKAGPLKLKAGLMLYDILAGILFSGKGHQMLSPKKSGETWPLLRKQGLKACFTYPDAATDDARLTLEVVAGALEQGAACVNHCRVVHLLRGDRGVCGAAVEDVLTGKTLEVKAKATVCAAGPWIPQLLPGSRAERLIRTTKGVHLVMPPLPVEVAFLLTAKKDNRVFFLIPWYGQTLVGTTDTDFNGPPEEAVPTEDDIAYLLGEANRVLDGIHWEAKDVRGAFAGLRSLRHQPGQPSAVTREWSLEAPERGLLVPVGGKLTTARVDAARIVARVWPMAGKSTPLPPSPTLARPLVWNPVEGSSSPRADFAAWAGRTAGELELLGVDPQTALFCTTRYGGSIGPLRQAVSARPDLARRIHPDLPFCRGEILHGVEQEMAFSLEDVLRRRIPLAILRPIGHEILKDAASLVGGALNWDEQKTNTEIQTFTRQNLQPQWLNG